MQLDGHYQEAVGQHAPGLRVPPHNQYSQDHAQRVGLAGL